MNTEEFIKRAKEVHGDKYDYFKVNYINSKTKVCIICPIHGEFWQSPDNHLHGKKCPLCSHRSFKYTTNEWIKLANIIHYEKYDYSKVNYINAKTKVCIICKEHGEFWQIPKHHLNGCGCPSCNNSHLEKNIKLFLENNNICFEQQKRFYWLGKQSLDFYLPQYNICIECQGIQHFKEVDFFGGIKSYEYTINNDMVKKDLLKEHNIPILYYSDLEGYDTFLDERLIKTEEELLTKINEFSQ